MAERARDWCPIAARMIEDGRVELSRESSTDYRAAAAFVFDQGIFYLPRDAQLEIVAMLRGKGRPDA